MSIKIHHGPPGSYKTSSAMFEDFTRAAIEGRPIVTNVRGVDDPARIREKLKPVIDAQMRAKLFPTGRRLRFWVRSLMRGRINDAVRKVRHARKSAREKIAQFDLKAIDTKTTAGLEEMRTFFHWAPPGTFFLIDEVNTVFPKTWRPSDLARYDYPGGVDQARVDQRPPDLVTALEMHRHWNWDFVLTTPHIRKVHDFLIQSAEKAYRHKNAATIGIPGRFWVYMHDADNAGKAKADIELQQIKRIPKWVYSLYSSTATGAVRDTISGQNIFKRPGVVGAGIGIFVLLFFVVGRISELLTHVEEATGKKETAELVDKGESENKKNSPVVPVSSKRVQVPVDREKPKTLGDFIFAGRLWYEGDHFGQDKFSVNIGDGNSYLTKTELELSGIYVKKVAGCLVLIEYQGKQKAVTCHKPENTQKPRDIRLAMFPSGRPAQPTDD